MGKRVDVEKGQKSELMRLAHNSGLVMGGTVGVIIGLVIGIVAGIQVT